MKTSETQVVNYSDLQNPSILKAYQELRNENTYTAEELEDIEILEGTAEMYLEALMDEHVYYSDELRIFSYTKSNKLLAKLLDHKILDELEIDNQEFIAINHVK